MKTWLHSFLGNRTAPSPAPTGVVRRMRITKQDTRQPEPLSAANVYRELVKSLGDYCGPLDGKRVLEAGAAPIPDFIADFDRTFALKEAVGINLVLGETKEFSSTLRLEHGDLRKIAYCDDYFDLIISSSVFEHLHNFDVALAEMYRVLKPGGFLFSTFGPIWSCSFGHHLWYVDRQDCITYHNLALPPYCHLLMTESELRDWLEGKNQPKAREIAKYALTSPEQNQMMFSDYERAVSESAFEGIFLKGYDAPVYTGRLTADCLSELNKKYPADKDKFLYDGITMLLRKAK
jgi:SAM-dependent methyltransferase